MSRKSSLDSPITEEDYQAFLAQREANRTCTNSGTPLNTLVYITDLPMSEYSTAKVYWNKRTNEFLLCDSKKWDVEITRTPESLRALAKMLAFNPKDVGCRRCGCTAEFRDDEYVCYCDTCVDGCDVHVALDPLPEAEPRKPSPFFALRGLLPPPPMIPLVRQIAVTGINDAFLDESHMSPLSPTAIPLNAEDAVRFILQ